MRVARLFALIRHALVYSASSRSFALATLAFPLADEPPVSGVLGIPHTLPAKWEELGPSQLRGSGGSASGGTATNAWAEASVAAIRETHVIVLPSPIYREL